MGFLEDTKFWYVFDDGFEGFETRGNLLNSDLAESGIYSRSF